MKIIQIPVTVDVRSVNWSDIELFKKRFAELWSNFKDLDISRLSGSFTKQKNGCYTGSLNLPNQHRLKGLYVDFRHFFLEKENTSIKKFADYLSSLTKSQEFRTFIKEEKKKLKSEFIENGWFQYNGKSFSTKQVIYLWFNVEIFHNIPHNNKMLLELFLEWKQIFSIDTARSMLFIAVYDWILIIRNIHWTVMELSKSNMNLRMPSKFTSD